MTKSASHYEAAFEHFVEQRRIPFVAVDQAKKAAFAGVSLKSFDYIVYPPNRPALLIDVKGRKLEKGTGRLPGQTWVTVEDIEGLARWEEVFGEGYLAAFVFAYWLAEPAGDAGGEVAGDGAGRREAADPAILHRHDGRVYSFWVAQLAGYRTCMKVRSARWQTVYVPRRLFRHWALPFDRYLGLRPRPHPGCESDQRRAPSR